MISVSRKKSGAGSRRSASSRNSGGKEGERVLSGSRSFLGENGSLLRFTFVLVAVFLVSSSLIFVGLEGFWKWKSSYFIGKSLSVASSSESYTYEEGSTQQPAKGGAVLGGSSAESSSPDIMPAGGRTVVSEGKTGTSQANYFQLQSGGNCVNISNSTSVADNPNITEYTASSLYEFKVNGSIELCTGFYNVNIPYLGSLFWINTSNVEIDLGGSVINGTHSYDTNFVIVFGHNSPDARQFANFTLKNGEVRWIYSVIGSSLFSQLNYSNFVVENLTFNPDYTVHSENYRVFDFPLIKDSSINDISVVGSSNSNVTAVYASKMYSVTINSSDFKYVKYAVKVNEMADSVIMHNNISHVSDTGISVFYDTCYGSFGLCPKSRVYDNAFSYTPVYASGGIIAMNTTYQCSAGITNILGGNCLGGNFYSELKLRDTGLGLPPFHNKSGDMIADDLGPVFSNADNGGNIDYLPLTDDGSSGCTGLGSGEVPGYAVLGNTTLCRDNYTVPALSKFVPAFFILMSSNATLDCNYSNFTGMPSEWRDIYPTGVQIYSPIASGSGIVKNVSLFNCRFYSLVRGFYIGNEADSFVIENVTVENGMYGFYNNPGGYDYISAEIRDSSFVNNTYNFYLMDTANGGSLVVDSCTIEDSERYGIYISKNYTNATFKNSVIYNNGDSTYPAIWINGSYNLFYNNNITNTLNIQTSNSDNYFNTTKTLSTNIVGGHYIGGNYWSDYSGTDSDKDDIGDTPYSVSGGGTDYLPLVEPVQCVNLYHSSSVTNHPYISSLGEGRFRITGDVTLCRGSYGWTLDTDDPVFDFSGSGMTLDCNGSTIYNYGHSNKGFGAKLGYTNDNVAINNCTFRYYKYGIYTDSIDANDNISGMIIANSTFYHNIDGLHLLDLSNSQVKGSVIQNSIGNGIYMSSAYHNLIVNNTIYNNSKGSGTYSGIYVAGADEYNNFTSNYIYDNGNDSGDSGLSFVGSNVMNNIVYDNYFNNSAPVFNALSYSSTNKFNGTYDCTRTNILGGTCSGGNFWADYQPIDNGKGEDAPHNVAGDGIADDMMRYIGSTSNTDYPAAIDYLPLTKLTSGCSTPAENIANLVLGNVTLCTGSYYIPSSATDRGAFEFNREGITLDCNGSTIYGDNIYNGIYLVDTGLANITIKNCIIKYYDYGIYVPVPGGNLEGLKLINVTSESNDYEGIYLINVDKYEIKDSTIQNNSRNGIYMKGCDYGIINNSVIYHNAQGNGQYRGILIYYSGSGNNITNNNISDNGVDSYDYGLYVAPSGNNLIYNNYFKNLYNNAYVKNGNKLNISKTAGTNIVDGSYLGGNYWYDYDGSDNDGDGLGDTPYTAGIAQDYAPLLPGYGYTITSIPSGVGIYDPDSRIYDGTAGIYDPDSRIHSYVNVFEQSRRMQIAKSDKPVAELTFEFDKGNVNLDNLVVDIDDNAFMHKVVLDSDNVQVSDNLNTSNHTLFVSADLGMGGFICPYAKTLSEVNSGCRDKISFTHQQAVEGYGYPGQAYPKPDYAPYGITVTLDFEGDYYRISGLFGTGVASSTDSELVIWDGADSEGGGNTYYPFDDIPFYANYTNITDGTHISGAKCNITFDDWATQHVMTDNGTLYNYTLAGGFGSAGVKTWQVNCSHPDFATLNVSDTITISSPSVPEFSDFTVVLALAVIISGFMIVRKRRLQ